MRANIPVIQYIRWFGSDVFRSIMMKHILMKH